MGVQLLPIALVCAAVATTVHGAVRLPAWFSDGVVLQTNAEYGARSFINGLASPGESVSVAVSGGVTYQAVADAAGTWVVEVRAHGSGPCTVTVSGENGPSVTAHDVQFGDVFFCSGQSNMVFPLELALNSSAEIATAVDPRGDAKNFKYFTVPLATSDNEEFDINRKGKCNTGVNCSQWVSATADYVKGFSAVCYLTARNIAALHTGSRPVGLVFSAWGGTRIEAWMSSDALGKCAEFPPHPVNPSKSPQEVRSALWNAMVAPFQFMAVRAVFWYQGEANADQGKGNPEEQHVAEYSCKLQAMVADWREKKGMGDVAFLNMQLPPSIPPASSTADPQTGRMAIRAAEAQAVSRTNGSTDIAGMAVTIDLGGKSAWGYDHPINKNEMSWRLARQAVHVAYAQQLSFFRSNPVSSAIWTGPELDSVSYDAGNKNVVLSLVGYSAEGIYLKDVPNCTLCCAKQSPFEVQLSANGTWTTVVPTLCAAEVTLSVAVAPVAVRYAWHDFVECVLVNNDSLPMGPFKTTDLARTSTTGEAQFEPTSAVHTASRGSPIQSPPMGFNSWNFYHCNIDENEIKQIADAMATNGMRDVGYEYINIDDCWQVGRESNGTIIADPARFPSGMKAVADYVHSKGLKFGVYTARGSRTCQNRPGSYTYELVDAATYCDWGLDYLKNDNCGGNNWKVENESWVRFKQGFDKCFADTGRYIVKSIEYCRSPTDCGQWIGDVANLWRTTGDIQNTWASVMGNIHSQNDMAPVARPGAFNDPDMLQVGNVGLTLTEQKTHFLLWCIASAPLLAATDLIHANADTLKILTASELIAVNQDLGKNNAIQGRILNSTGDAEVWVKYLADKKTIAVALVNLGDAAQAVSVVFADVGIAADTSVAVRDAYARKDVGSFKGTYTQTLDSHDSVLLVLTPQ
eukprot:m.1331336 g.1331336  ORF g.1331336 m.1331336 type:complete len:916 (+) comp24863_c1_seq1:65-2812(+)